MATGAGKTRTVIALVDLLMRANWAKRVLFLADRTALVNQAVNAFKAHLPDSAPVNLVTEGNEDGRVYVSTYQTMVGMIDEYRRDGDPPVRVGHFDLVVIDEAHRSVFQKYRAIFDYFDSLLVGLTATPKDEVDTNTYGLFDLETGVPTDAYGLDEAVADGSSCHREAVSVPLKFLREGIRYDDLSEDEKDEWDELDWGEDEDGDRSTPDAGRRRGDQQVAVQRRHRRQGARAPDDPRPSRSPAATGSARRSSSPRTSATPSSSTSGSIANYPQLDHGDFARVITHAREVRARA